MVPPSSRTPRPHQVGNPTTDPIAAIAHWREQIDDPLFVYFIQSGEDGPVKIGKALDPLKRRAELQCGSPVPLRLRAVVLAGIDLEESLHQSWSSACVGGEWFAGGIEKTLIDFALKAMAAQIGTPKQELYHASSTLVANMVSPAKVAA